MTLHKKIVCWSIYVHLSLCRPFILSNTYAFGLKNHPQQQQAMGKQINSPGWHFGTVCRLSAQNLSAVQLNAVQTERLYWFQCGFSLWLGSMSDIFDHLQQSSSQCTPLSGAVTSQHQHRSPIGQSKVEGLGHRTACYA